MSNYREVILDLQILNGDEYVSEFKKVSLDMRTLDKREDDFREVVLRTDVLQESSNFVPVIVDISQEFIDSGIGYGRHFGLYYGRGL